MEENELFFVNLLRKEWPIFLLFCHLGGFRSDVKYHCCFFGYREKQIEKNGTQEDQRVRFQEIAEGAL